MSVGFDALAVAVDWLYAYRAAKLEAMLDLYDDDASIECGCGGENVLIGKAELKDYWINRFARKSALELDDIQPAGDGVALAYQSSEGLVQVMFSFSASGKIARTHCVPSAKITPLRPASL
jgi:hypothetical protein